MLMRDTEGYIYQGGIGKLRQKKKGGMSIFYRKQKRDRHILSIYMKVISMNYKIELQLTTYSKGSINL